MINPSTTLLTTSMQSFVPNSLTANSKKETFPHNFHVILKQTLQNNFEIGNKCVLGTSKYSKVFILKYSITH